MVNARRGIFSLLGPLNLVLILSFNNVFAVDNALPYTGFAQTRSGRVSDAEAIKMTRKLIDEIVAEAFPKLVDGKFKINAFRSEATFFKTRFSFSRYLTFRRVEYVMFVNPAVFERDAPEEGLRAILAHELAHADYYRRNGGFKTFGMIRLLSKRSIARFERGADLVAIEKGYGAGLKSYREWLYKNIPAKEIAKKERNYFSPHEIDLLTEAQTADPTIIERIMDDVPRTPVETSATIRKHTSPKSQSFRRR